jgi:hypothetical protein
MKSLLDFFKRVTGKSLWQDVKFVPKIVEKVGG